MSWILWPCRRAVLRMVSARETGLKWQAAVQALGACTDLRAAKPAAIWIVRWFAQHSSFHLELPCSPSTAGCKKKVQRFQSLHVEGHECRRMAGLAATLQGL